jgi:Putative auto-transporter adhesin, head GIN domain
MLTATVLPGVAGFSSVSAALAGSGALTANAIQQQSVSATLSGSGALIASAIQHQSVSSALSGSGAFTANVVRQQPVSATLSGSGTLSAAVTPAFAVSAAFSGAGTVTATVAPQFASNAALSGSGTLSASMLANYACSAALSGGGILSATVVSVAMHYSDDFNRANSTTTMGTDWTNRALIMGINGNAAYGVNASGSPVASYNPTMAKDDHSVSVVIGTLQGSGTDATFLYLGADIGGTGMVGLAWTNTTGSAIIRTKTAWSGGVTTQATVTSVTYTTGDTLKISRIGNVYTVTKNGSAVGSGLTWTDSGNIIPRDSSHRTVVIGSTVTTANYRRIDSFAADDI